MTFGTSKWGNSVWNAKDILEKHCRTCTHNIVAHYQMLGKQNKPPYPCREGRCKCIEYLPTDNLEYLEYMNERVK